MHTAIAIRSVSIGAFSGLISGLHIYEKYTLQPCGEIHVLPLLPRPMLCTSLTTSNPLSHPASARLEHLVAEGAYFRNLTVGAA